MPGKSVTSCDVGVFCPVGGAHAAGRDELPDHRVIQSAVSCPGPEGGLEGSKVPIGNGGSEYEAGLLAADGKTGIDTAWLREQLDMPGDLAD